MMDKIIQEYQDHAQNNSHPAKGSVKISAPDLPLDEAKIIGSVIQKVEVEKKVFSILSILHAQLNGCHYSLETMKPGKQKPLV